MEPQNKAIKAMKATLFSRKEEKAKKNLPCGKKKKKKKKKKARKKEGGESVSNNGARGTAEQKQRNKGTREQGNKGTREQENKRTREQENKRTREQENREPRKKRISGKHQVFTKNTWNKRFRGEINKMVGCLLWSNQHNQHNQQKRNYLFFFWDYYGEKFMIFLFENPKNYWGPF